MLAGVFGKKTQLQTGDSVTVDEGYVRESILNPQAKLVAGFGAIMPTFQGQITEDQLMQLVAFIKSLPAGEQTQPATATTPAARPAGSPTQNLK
jgi:cytochrome c oxidase subunit 2